jgi:uncharacterized membrane protein YheB (UPF0754 family)
MSVLWFALISMSVGGLIGGVTNALAIKMLFRPRQPWTLLGRRVPFTPGVIPKRKEEIAAQLGRVVAEYLLTEEGVQETLLSSDGRQRAEDWLRRVWDGARRYEGTWEEAIRSYIPSNTWDQGVEVFGQIHGEKLQALLEQAWSSPEWAGRPLSAMFSSHEQEKEVVSRGITEISSFLLIEVARFLESPDGEDWFKAITKQVGGSGLFGGLAGRFVSETGLSGLILEPVVRYLKTPEARQTVEALLHGRWEEWRLKPWQVILDQLPKEATLHLAQGLAARWLTAERLLSGSVARTLVRFDEKMEEWIPGIAHWLLQRAAGQIHKLLDAIDIKQTVQKQVSRFPLERLEEVILHVSGSEFRMITWLGVILGIGIGALQALWYWLSS